MKTKILVDFQICVSVPLKVFDYDYFLNSNVEIFDCSQPPLQLNHNETMLS